MSEFAFTVKDVRNISIINYKYEAFKEGETSDDYLSNNEYINTYLPADRFRNGCDDYEYNFVPPKYSTFDLDLPKLLMEKYPSIRMYTKINKSLINTIQNTSSMYPDWMKIQMKHNFISIIYTNYNFNIVIDYTYSSVFETNIKTNQVRYYYVPRNNESWEINILFPDDKTNEQINVNINEWTTTQLNIYPKPDNVESAISKIIAILDKNVTPL